MIKMIIVDDEYIILNSLTSLIDWKSIGIEIVGTADNGAAALDLAVKQHPDIILSDISMPCFSGLEMLETLRRHNMQTEVIFITAYGKFEYAREAIRYGAFDYILKPIDESLLLSVVSRCAAGIRTKQPRSEEQLTNMLLRCILQGKPPDEAEWIQFREKVPEQYSHALVIGIRHETESRLQVNPSDYSPAWVSAPLRAADYLTLIMICSSEPFRANWATLTRQWAAVSPDMIAAVSQDTVPAECFKKSFAQISFTLIGAEIRRQKTASAFYTPVFFAELQKTAATGFPGFDHACSALDACVREGRAEPVQELLYRFFLGFLDKELFYDSDLVALYCFELIDHVLKENEDYIDPTTLTSSLSDNQPKNSLYSGIAIKKKISACTGLYKVFHAACSILTDLCTAAGEDHVHSSLRLVRQAVRFIHEHYEEDISLPSIAAQLYISPNYLSRIFRTEMGKPLSRYLLEHRINTAKKLLRETYDKVYEIAAKVGYADVIHFSKIFKQLTGISPNQYRNKSTTSP